MGSIFKKPKEPEFIIPPSPPPETKEDTSAREAAEREAERIRRKRKVAGTIITGPQGLTEPPTTLKQKLGE